MMKTRILLLSVAALALAGCSAPAASEPAGTTPAPPPAASEQYGTDADFPMIEDPSDPAYAAGPGFDSPAPFGQAVTYPSGFEVTVESVVVRDLTAEEAVDYGEPGRGVLEVAYTVKNGTGQRVDGIMVTTSTRADGEGEQFMWDSETVGTLFAGESGSGVERTLALKAEAAELTEVIIGDPTGYGPSAIWEGKP